MGCTTFDLPSPIIFFSASNHLHLTCSLSTLKGSQHGPNFKNIFLNTIFEVRGGEMVRRGVGKKSAPNLLSVLSIYFERVPTCSK